MAARFTFDKKIAEIKKAFARLPVEVGGVAKRHFVRSFTAGGFTDDVFVAWKQRTTKNRSDRRNPARRAILVDSGTLKNSGQVKRADWDSIVVGFYGVPYARYHNRGETPQPKRQFIGSSKQLTRDVSKIINNAVKKSLNS